MLVQHCIFESANNYEQAEIEIKHFISKVVEFTSEEIKQDILDNVELARNNGIVQWLIDSVALYRRENVVAKAW